MSPSSLEYLSENSELMQKKKFRLLKVFSLQHIYTATASGVRPPLSYSESLCHIIFIPQVLQRDDLDTLQPPVLVELMRLKHLSGVGPSGLSPSSIQWSSPGINSTLSVIKGNSLFLASLLLFPSLSLSNSFSLCIFLSINIYFSTFILSCSHSRATEAVHL